MGRLKRLGSIYRTLCGLISLFCLMALVGILAFGRDEGVHAQMLMFISVIGLFLYTALVITITGYPPSFLRWASGKK